MPYFLDGNNVIGTARGRAAFGEEERSALVTEVAARLRATRSSVRIFFDGPPGPTVVLGPLTVRLPGGSADEAILRELSATRDPGQVTVVTADRDLSRRVRDGGGKVLTPTDFWSKFGTGSHPAPKGPDAKVDVDDWMTYFSDPKNRG